MIPSDRVSMTSEQENLETLKDSKGAIDNEFYMRIWEKQQDVAISRWSIITFFMSVSFALFGLSLQVHTTPTSIPTIAPTVRVNLKRAHLFIENRPTWGM